jgi:hypothetical protein
MSAQRTVVEPAAAKQSAKHNRQHAHHIANQRKQAHEARLRLHLQARRLAFERA